MANQKIFEGTVGGIPHLYMEYNDANLRVGKVYFTVPAGVSATVRIWNEGSLVFSANYSAGSYEENVPGNYRVVEQINPEDGSTYASLPQEIAYSYSEIRL